MVVEPTTGMQLGLVRGGRLEAGAAFDAGQERLVQLPPAEIPDYYLGRFEVTQAQWERVMGANPSRVRGDRRPVEQVSWDQAAEFARRLSALAGRPFRLPSEAEWAWAFRSGGGPGPSSDASGLAAYAGDAHRPIRDAGSPPANSLGIFDLAGNVSEWCADPYSPRPAEAGPGGDPDDGYRVLRGAAGGAAGEGISGAYRIGFHRAWVGRTVGFRVVSPATW